MSAEVYNLSILLFCSYISAAIFTKLKVPASRLLGPILLIAILKISGLNLNSPSYLSLFFSVILGVFFGLKFNKTTIKQFKATITPSLFLIIWYIMITILLGYLLKEISFLDKGTAYLAVIPGGIAEVSILGASYHADMAQVTAFQLMRLLTVILIIPLLVKKLVQLDKPIQNQRDEEKSDETEQNADISSNWWIYFPIGIIGSCIFTLLDFPAASLIGALVSVGIFNVFSKYKVTSPPENLYNLAQWGMGGIIGTSFTLESLISITHLLIPIFIMTFFIIFNSLILAWIFSRIFKWKYITCFLSIVPGGLTPMMLIADEVDADIVVVSILQIVRLLTAILIIPLFYAILI